VQKVGISIEDDNLDKLVKGDRQAIMTIFMRIERFITKIAGKKIFEFPEIAPP